MTPPPLYAEGLLQHSRQGFLKLCVYKLGLIEAILKQALRADDGPDVTTMRSAMGTAVEVAQWEPRPPKGSGPPP